LLKQKIVELQKSVPSLTVDAHFIIAYPGETEEKFQSLLTFIKWLFEVNPRNEFKSFCFSADPRTEAAMLPGQIPDKTGLNRCYKMEKLAFFKARELRKNAIKKIKNPLKRIRVNLGYIFLGSPLMFLEKFFFWTKAILEYDVLKDMKVCPNAKILNRARSRAVEFDALEKSD